MSEPLSAAEDFKRGVAYARTDERERCALLNEMLATIYEARAEKMRREGSFTTRSIWPPFKKVTFVAPKWEQAAKDIETAARSLRVVATCIRKGYDPRKKVPCASCDTSCSEPSECDRPRDDVWGPCPACTDPMDCGSWKTCMASRGQRERGQ